MSPNNRGHWTPDKLLELGRSFQAAAVFAAAADLDLFSHLAAQPLSVIELSRKLKCPPRGLDILLHALVALNLLANKDGKFTLLPGMRDMLTAQGSNTVLGMAQHQANCLRRWAQLARVVQSGKPAEREPSVRGQIEDMKSFIEAMHNISSPVADQVIQAVQPLQFKHLLDVGGASGTWTLAFLRACPEARATVFDLPEVLPMGRKRSIRAKMTHRIRWVAGNFLADDLPVGADLAWISAIVHQNSPRENRLLMEKVHAALAPGGRVAVRDIVMEPSRVAPVAGALFAVNMLVGTDQGSTYTFAELKSAMELAGFDKVRVVRRDAGMNSVIIGQKKAV